MVKPAEWRGALPIGDGPLTRALASENVRPQDVGRTHRKLPPRVRKSAILEKYQSVMRDELRGLLAELGERTLALQDREKRWRLAIMLARELGSDLAEPTTGKPTSIATVPHDTAAPEF